MFTEINALLEVDVDKTIIVGKELDSTDGSFLVHHFISQYMRNGHSACLVAVDQGFEHYYNVALKLGYNLIPKYENGNLKIIDLLHLTSSQVDDQNTDSLFKPNGLCAKQLFKKIKDTIIQFQNSQSKHILIIDKLSSLLDLGVSISDVLGLVSSCAALIQCDPLGNLFIMNKVNQEDEQQSIVNSLCEHMAGVTLCVKCLTTGKCKEVTGTLSVVYHKDNDIPACKDMHYNIQDRNVKIFPTGTAVL